MDLCRYCIGNGPHKTEPVERFDAKFFSFNPSSCNCSVNYIVWVNWIWDLYVLWTPCKIIRRSIWGTWRL